MSTGKIVESCSNRYKGGLGRGRHFQGDMVACMRTVMPKPQDWCKRVLTSLKRLTASDLIIRWETQALAKYTRMRNAQRTRK